ncbi:hypothetical protein DSECCO2_546750 [anaerobic digester metagenome]
MLCHSVKCTLKGVIYIGHGPAFNVAVIGCNGDVGKDSKNTHILPKPALAHCIHNKRG